MSVVGSVSVRVVPSFSGVHRQIAQQMTGATSQAASQAGRAAGQQMSKSMSTSLNLQSVGRQLSSVGDSIAGVGSKLTRSITLPVAGATAAVGGLTAALGWKRLVSLDTAQGQLRGLGYEAEEVERITGQVSTALEGGMMTLGEGAGVAAGALAAGVEEGKELERYIGLVDSASVGMNASAAETAGIFNRIQGSGKLMRNELDMIEFRMPGFQNAVADSLGVTVDEMYNMVSAGEVTSDQFLDVMENFAGGMAEEHAKTWEGMVQNTLAYVGILGENILSGVFQMSKDELGLFILELKEAGDSEWAKQLGSTIRNVFSSVVDAIKSAVSWWRDLDTEQQKAIGAWAGVAVAAGPFLLVVGKIISFIASLITGVGAAIGYLSQFASWLGVTGGATGLLRAALGLLGRGILVLTGPIGWIIGGLIAMWTSSEDLRSAVGNLASTLWDAFQRIWDAVSPLVELLGAGLAAAFKVVGDLIGWVAGLLGDGLATYIEMVIIPQINLLADAIEWLADWLLGLGDTTTTQGGVIAAVWQWLMGVVSSVVGWFTGTALPALVAVWDGIASAASWMWSSVLQPVFRFVQSAFSAMVAAIQAVWTGVLRPVFQAVASVVQWLWSSVAQPVFRFISSAWSTMVSAIQAVWTGVLRPVIQLVADIIRWLFSSVARPIFNSISSAWRTMTTLISGIWTGTLRPMFQAFGAFVRSVWQNFIRPAFNAISDRWSWLTGRLSAVWRERIRPIFQAVGDFVRTNLVDRIRSGIDMIQSAWRTLANIFRKPINWVIRRVWNNGVAKAFNNVADAVGSDASLSNIPTIGAYAKGGKVAEDWYIAGEEGPELIHRGRDSHRVYTADETAKALAAGGAGDVPEDAARKAAGSRPSDALLPMGGSIFDRVGDWVSGAVSWVRGSLARAAESLLKPLLEPVKGAMAEYDSAGELGAGFVDWGVDKVLDWIRGEDTIPPGGVGGDGSDLFDGPTGAWKRPSRGPITSWYGPRWGGVHSGIDIAGGGPTFAAYNGVVQKSGWNVLPGRTGVGILLSHGGGLQTYYGHNPVGGPRVSVGDQVSAGQHIGYQGATGNVTGTHLHWELLRGGRAQNVNSMFRDKGGLIYPGMNQVLNETGGAEYVFNQRQFDNLNRLAEGGGGRSAAIEQLTINGVVPSEMERGLQRAVFRELKRQGVPVAVS